MCRRKRRGCAALLETLFVRAGKQIVKPVQIFARKVLEGYGALVEISPERYFGAELFNEPLLEKNVIGLALIGACFCGEILQNFSGVLNLRREILISLKRTEILKFQPRAVKF